MEKIHLMLIILILLASATLLFYPKDILIVKNDTITLCLCTGFLKDNSNTEKVCYGIKSDCIIIEDNRFLRSLEPDSCINFNCSQVEDYLDTQKLERELTELSKRNSWIVLMIDNSGSMYGKKMEHTLNAAVRLINDLKPDDRAAVVEFHDSAHIVHNFSSNKTSLMKNIMGITPGGKTKYVPALDLAFSLFNDLGFNNIDKEIIFISDGSPDDSIENIIDKVKQISQNNISLYTISIGDITNTTTDLDQIKTLNDMAMYNINEDIGKTAYSITNIEELYHTFNKIIKQKRATQGNILIEGEIDKANMYTDELLEIRSMAMSANNKNIIPGFEIKDNNIICAPEIEIIAEFIDEENDIIKTERIEYNRHLQTYRAVIGDLHEGIYQVLLRASLDIDDRSCLFQTEKFIGTVNVSRELSDKECYFDCNASIGEIVTKDTFSVVPADKKEPIDITLLIDNSGSIEKSNLEYIKDMSYALTDMISGSDQIAIITFSETADLAVQFTGNKDLLYERISSIFTGSIGTYYLPALNKVVSNFRNSRKNTKKILILFSDGLSHEREDAEEIINQAKSLTDNGICIYSVGIGPSALRQTPARDLLRALAIQSIDNLDCGGFLFPSKSKDTLAPILDMRYIELIRGKNDLRIDISKGRYTVNQTIYLEMDVFSNYNGKTITGCPAKIRYDLRDKDNISLDSGAIKHYPDRHYYHEIRGLEKGNYTVYLDAILGQDQCIFRGEKTINLTIIDKNHDLINRSSNKGIAIMLGMSIAIITLTAILFIRRLRI